MVKTIEELMTDFHALIGDNSTDEAINFMDDLADSFNTDKEDWKSKYEENDKAWRSRYKERFLRGNDEEEFNEENVQENEDEEMLSFDDLFKESEVK